MPRKKKDPGYTIRFVGTPHPIAIAVVQAHMLGLLLPGESPEMVRADLRVRTQALIDALPTMPPEQAACYAKAMSKPIAEPAALPISE